MAESIFRFKRFSVRNERSAMKVNTDGVLLGAIADIPPHDGLCEVLDAGTGTGTIALMLAQRLSDNGCEFSVTGIDIDEASATEARANFENSPWSKSMQSQHVPLSECEGRFDLIVSNPPYYDDSLQNPDARKNTARHTVASDEEGLEGAPMSYRTLLEYAMTHLKGHGRLAVVLPADQEAALLRHARMCGFVPEKAVRVSTTTRKAPSRIIVQFAQKKCSPPAQAEGQHPLTINLSIQDGGEYTSEYTLLMKEFYLWA